jgi:phosphate/sulfate permease
MMLGASLASFMFIMASSLFGMPISGTHTVVGALIGAGISGLGSSHVNWGYLGRIIFSWFLSPALTTVLAFCLFTAVCYLTLGGRGIRDIESVDSDGDKYTRIRCKKLSFRAKMIWLTLISGFSSTMVTYMVVFLASQETTPFDSIMMQLLIPIAFIGGILLCRIVLVMSALKTARIQQIETEVHS